MTFAQQRTHLTKNFLEHIFVVKRHMTVRIVAVSRCDSGNEHVYTNKHFPPSLHHKLCSFQDEIRNNWVCFIVPRSCYWHTACHGITLSPLRTDTFYTVKRCWSSIWQMGCVADMEGIRKMSHASNNVTWN